MFSAMPQRVSCSTRKSSMIVTSSKTSRKLRSSYVRGDLPSIPRAAEQDRQDRTGFRRHRQVLVRRPRKQNERRIRCGNARPRGLRILRSKVPQIPHHAKKWSTRKSPKSRQRDSSAIAMDSSPVRTSKLAKAIEPSSSTCRRCLDRTGQVPPAFQAFII